MLYTFAFGINRIPSRSREARNNYTLVIRVTSLSNKNRVGKAFAKLEYLDFIICDYWFL